MRESERIAKDQHQRSPDRVLVSLTQVVASKKQVAPAKSDSDRLEAIRVPRCTHGRQSPCWLIERVGRKTTSPLTHSHSPALAHASKKKINSNNLFLLAHMSSTTGDGVLKQARKLKRAQVKHSVRLLLSSFFHVVPVSSSNWQNQTNVRESVAIAHTKRPDASTFSTHSMLFKRLETGFCGFCGGTRAKN